MHKFFIFAIFAGLIFPHVSHAMVVGENETVTANYEDTLIGIARAHDLGFTEVQAANPGIDPWLPGKGTEILLPKRNIVPGDTRKGFLINLAEMRLYAFDNEGNVKNTFPLGIGREGFDTPIGQTTITWKRTDPTWTPTPDMREADPSLPKVVQPGPDNPLGTHAIYLGWPNYLMHGTARPWGIGRRVSSGCMRFYPEDIIKLYDMAEKGDTLTIVNEPIKLAWQGESLYLEAHPRIEDNQELISSGQVDHYEIDNGLIATIEKVAGEYADQLDWRHVKDVLVERLGYPIEIFQKPVMSEDLPS